MTFRSVRKEHDRQSLVRKAEEIGCGDLIMPVMMEVPNPYLGIVYTDRGVQ